MGNYITKMKVEIYLNMLIITRTWECHFHFILPISAQIQKKIILSNVDDYDQEAFICQFTPNQYTIMSMRADRLTDKHHYGWIWKPTMHYKTFLSLLPSKGWKLQSYKEEYRSIKHSAVQYNVQHRTPSCALACLSYFWWPLENGNINIVENVTNLKLVVIIVIMAFVETWK